MFYCVLVVKPVEKPVEDCGGTVCRAVLQPRTAHRTVDSPRGSPASSLAKLSSSTAATFTCLADLLLRVNCLKTNKPTACCTVCFTIKSTVLSDDVYQDPTETV